VQVTEQTSKQRSRIVERPRVRGKFLFVGNEKFWVRGVSYGTFSVDENGNEQLTPEAVKRDFARMAENGFNVVRVHICPPRWLLDTAMEEGLRVMVGLNWGERMSFVDEPGRPREIEERIRRWVRRCKGHPAVFCYSVGNEISSVIARWTGRRRVEKFIERLYNAAKEEDPDSLVTYVNYPSTEYLQLPFLDFISFNVYLESSHDFERYIARLHSLSEDRPVLISEIGLDGLRNGEEKQAETLDWQIRTIFRNGCCGVVVFQWTDEWYHGTVPVEDWKFGLTTGERVAKPALQAVRRAFFETPFPENGVDWPRISVVVCSFNGASTIRETLDGLQSLDYPGYEVVVVNDGSTDSTPKIVSEYPVRLINTENRGLSHARNTGVSAATGEIIAFIDDDAYPDAHWLRYLALSLVDRGYTGVGGPNLPPPNDGWKAEAVASAPGPNPVLISDTVAEHIPGCNMALRRGPLQAISGFDPIFRAAGDDVDLCWRLRERGGIIGFAPAALVWHHRRKSLYKYWRQQVGYGRAEALLERKWPEKYNVFGQLNWLGRIYGRGVSLDFSSLGGRIYHGIWGSAPFQSLYGSSRSLWSLSLMPEWYLVIAGLALMLVLSIGWGPVMILGTLLSSAIALPAAQAIMNAERARLDGYPKSRWQAFKLRTTIFSLHLLQPLARLYGRLGGGLTPWRRRGTGGRGRFGPSTMTLWRDTREAPEITLAELQRMLQDSGAVVAAGGNYDSWDLEMRGGLLGASRLLLATEDYPSGKQLLRFRITPRYSRLGLAVCAPLAAISIAAGLSNAWTSSIASALMAGGLIFWATSDARFASSMFLELLRRKGAT